MGTLYEKLGVAPTATAPEITRAYRRQAMKYHPDRHPGAAQASAQEAFHEINSAFQTLSDPERRAQYDEQLRMAEKLRETARQQDGNRTHYDAWVKLAVGLTAAGQGRDQVYAALEKQGCPPKHADHISNMAMIRRAHFRRGRHRPRVRRFWRIPKLLHAGKSPDPADKAALWRRRMQLYALAGTSFAVLLAAGIASTMGGDDDVDTAPALHKTAAGTGPRVTAHFASQPVGASAELLASAAQGSHLPSVASELAALRNLQMSNGSGPRDDDSTDRQKADATPEANGNDALADRSASAAAAAAVPVEPYASPIQSQIAHFDPATGTGTINYAQLPPGSEFAEYRSQLSSPFTIRLLTTRLLAAAPRRVLYVFASTSTARAQDDCDRCKALVSAMVTQQVDQNSEAVTIPLTVLAALGTRGTYDTRANRPAIVEVGPGKQGLILKDSTNYKGAMKESALFFEVGSNRMNRLGKLVTRIDMTETAECAANHSPRVPADMMCPNWSASYFFVKDKKDSMYALSAHALGTEWLVPSHTPFPVDEQHVVVSDGHGEFIETAERHDGATPTVSAELLGKSRIPTVTPKRHATNTPGAGRIRPGSTLPAPVRLRVNGAVNGTINGPVPPAPNGHRVPPTTARVPPPAASPHRQGLLISPMADAAY